MKIKSGSWATEIILQSGNSVFVEGWGGRGGRGGSRYTHNAKKSLFLGGVKEKMEEEEEEEAKREEDAFFVFVKWESNWREEGKNKQTVTMVSEGKKFWKIKLFFWRRREWRGRRWCFPLEEDGEEEEESDIYIQGEQNKLKITQRPPKTLPNTLWAFFKIIVIFGQKNQIFGAISSQNRHLWEGQLSLTGAPHPGVPVEIIQISPNFVVKNKIGSKVVHFLLFVSFWLPLLLYSKIT